MENITIRQPDAAELESLGVEDWSIWTHEVAQFPWYYEMEETCYFLEGKVTVIPAEGEAVEMGKGDLVTFAQGLECEWVIHEDVRKHYRFR